MNIVLKCCDPDSFFFKTWNYVGEYSKPSTFCSTQTSPRLLIVCMDFLLVKKHRLLEFLQLGSLTALCLLPSVLSIWRCLQNNKSGTSSNWSVIMHEIWKRSEVTGEMVRVTAVGIRACLTNRAKRERRLTLTGSTNGRGQYRCVAGSFIGLITMYRDHRKSIPQDSGGLKKLEGRKNYYNYLSRTIQHVNCCNRWVFTF